MSLRLDRLLTLYFFGPLSKLFPPKKGICIPILMYHSISDEKESGHPYFWINTSPARFAEHMKFLHDNGYQVIPLSTAVDLIRKSSSFGPESSILKSQTSTPEHVSGPRNGSLTRNEEPETRNNSFTRIPRSGGPAPHFVVLTFDDGYQDFYAQAFPVLKQYGFTATAYLPTSFIDNSKSGLKGKKHLTWREARELQAEGIEFGSHTMNHLQLRDLKPEIIELEVRGSKREIEDKTGREIRSFCYPYKFPEQDDGFINLLRDVLQKAGYSNGVSTKIGIAHRENEVFFLKRIPANSADDLPFFGAKLDGNYDWISKFQYFSKKLRASTKNQIFILPNQPINK